MPTARIVEAVDVFENGDFDLSSCLPVSAPDHFGLEGFEKALDSCVVIAVALSAHALPDSGCLNPREGTLSGHVQCADRQVLLHPVTDDPTDYPTGMQVQDDGQIDPAFARPDIGDVTGPFLVGLGWLGLA